MKFVATSLLASTALAAVANDLHTAQQAVADIPVLMEQPLYRRFANGKLAPPKGNPLAGLFKTKSAGAKPTSSIPMVSKIIDSPQFPGAKRVNIRYGPYRLPSPKEKNWESMIMKVSGMTDTFEVAKKPCETCVIFQSVMELQDAQGTAVKTAWLHHGGVMMKGKGLTESMCGVPGIQGLFEQGNEKTELPQADATGGLKVGYHIEPHYQFLLSNEMVNMNPEEQWVWNNIAYDFIDGENPDYKQVKSLLLTVGLIPSCTGGKNIWGASNLTITGQPRPEMKVFSEHATPWISPYAGTLIGAGGHLHDGGTSVQVYLNDKLVCDSIAKYQKGVADAHSMGSGSYDATAEHLASMGGCSVNEPMKKGDAIRIVANYDFNAHPGMKNNQGVLDEVMGMSGIVIATDYTPKKKL